MSTLVEPPRSPFLSHWRQQSNFGTLRECLGPPVALAVVLVPPVALGDCLVPSVALAVCLVPLVALCVCLVPQTDLQELNSQQHHSQTLDLEPEVRLTQSRMVDLKSSASFPRFVVFPSG